MKKELVFNLQLRTDQNVFCQLLHALNAAMVPYKIRQEGDYQAVIEIGEGY